MKIIKYLLAALLVISISKKIHLTSTDALFDSKTYQTAPHSLIAMRTTMISPTAPTIKEATALPGLPHSKVQSLVKNLRISPFYQQHISQFVDQHIDYDFITRIARKHDPLTGNTTTYVGVIESNPTTHQIIPDCSIPALRQFAKISSNHSQGAQSSKITNLITTQEPLYTYWYGIPVSGREIPIKVKKKTVGYYWPNNKIAQLNNGKTFVTIIESAQGNYTKRDYHAMGPVYTWFNTPQISQDLLSLYGISIKDHTFANLVPAKGIGTIRNVDQHKTYTLYGVQLDCSQALQKPFTIPTTSKTLHIPSVSHITRYPNIPGMDKFTQNTQSTILQRPPKSMTQSQGAYQTLQQSPEAEPNFMPSGI